MFLPGLAVVFVGIVGNSPKTIDMQVKVMLRDDANVGSATLDPQAVATLAHHGDGSVQIVKRMHVDGVVGGELIASHGHRTLRVVVYDGAGSLKSLSEVPVSGHVLSPDELDVLHSNIADEVTALGGHKPAEDIEIDAPAPAKPIAKTSEKIVDPFVSAPKVVAKVEPPKPAPAPAKPLIVTTPIASASTRPPASAASSLGFVPDESHDSDLRSADAKPYNATHIAAAVQTADATETVSASDIEAMMNGGEETGGGDVQAAAPTESDLHLFANAGIGIAGRSFAGPATLPGYSSSGVAAIHLEAGVRPTAHTTLGVLGERTLQMGTPLQSGMADTTMSRWEATAGYTLNRGNLAVTPQLGVGRRSFSVDSADPARTPDTEYNYLVIGGRASLKISPRISVHGTAAFEPVVSGAEPTEMAFGEASRWALAVGAALDVRLLTHVFARVSADYQRFSWSWDQAGARGADGAVDSYPSGTLSLGADY